MPRKIINTIEELEQVNVKYDNVELTCDICNEVEFIKNKVGDYYKIPFGWSYGLQDGKVICKTCNEKRKRIRSSKEYELLDNVLMEIRESFPIDDDYFSISPDEFDDMKNLYSSIKEIIESYEEEKNESS